VQVTAFAATYGGVQGLYKAIRNALDGKKTAVCECEWLGAQDLFREEGDAHGKAIDFQLITR